MADKSSIEWLNGGSTWNPIRARRKSNGKKGWACVRISPGCERCYSEKQNIQCGTNPTRHGTGLKYNVPALEQVELFLDEKTLLEPLHWKKGRLIFPCSMTDWMADFVPDEWRDKMLAVMAMTPQHTYLTLTKRADRQRKYFTDQQTSNRVGDRMGEIFDRHKQAQHPGWQFVPEGCEWRPLPNLWLGISAESQPYADSCIPELLQTPAAVRWVSAEPLLSAVDIFKYLAPPVRIAIDGPQIPPRLDWCVVGGESGPGARPAHPDWFRSLRDQCKAAGVPYFFKQWGEHVPVHPHTVNRGDVIALDGQWFQRVGKKAAGRLLDGKLHNEYPEVAR